MPGLAPAPSRGFDALPNTSAKNKNSEPTRMPHEIRGCLTRGDTLAVPLWNGTRESWALTAHGAAQDNPSSPESNQGRGCLRSEPAINTSLRLKTRALTGPGALSPWRGQRVTSERVRDPRRR